METLHLVSLILLILCIGLYEMGRCRGRYRNTTSNRYQHQQQLLQSVSIHTIIQQQQTSSHMDNKKQRQ